MKSPERRSNLRDSERKEGFLDMTTKIHVLKIVLK